MEPQKNTSQNIAQLINWLNSMGEKGYYKKSTVSAKIASIKNITDILNEKEQTDLLFLYQNIDSIVNRWATKTNAAPASIGPTKSHLKSSIEDYLEYQENPANFMPKTKRKIPIENKINKKKNKTRKITEEPCSKMEITSHKGFLPTIHIDIQIHIAADAPDSQIEKIFECIAKYLNR